MASATAVALAVGAMSFHSPHDSNGAKSAKYDRNRDKYERRLITYCGHANCKKGEGETMKVFKVIANDIMPIYETETGEKIVNARVLHEKLFILTRFNDWIARMIDSYGFIEGEDFYSFLSKSGGRPTREYHLTLDTAKEIAMVQNNEAGRAIRKYFIKVEKQYRQQYQLPKTQAEMMLMAAQQLVEQEKRINRLENDLAAAHHRIDNFDKIDTIGDKQQRLNKMIRLYAGSNGYSFAKAWKHFRSAFNTAYRTNLKLLIENYKFSHGLKELSMPEYLSRVDRLDDAIRVADKLLNGQYQAAK
jgi:phage anti-repressor protein